jgi:low affinity Fe/Cu permease
MKKSIPLREKIDKLCVSVSDWFAHPVAIALTPVICGLYLFLGGPEERLTLILSILAISLTQMVLAAQNIDAEASRLQIIELVRAIPNANNKVIKQDLTYEERTKLEEEINNEISKKV